MPSHLKSLVEKFGTGISSEDKSNMLGEMKIWKTFQVQKKNRQMNEGFVMGKMSFRRSSSGKNICIWKK